MEEIEGIEVELEKLGEILEEAGKKYFEQEVDVCINGIGSSWVTGNVLAEYIAIKMKQGYGVEEVLGELRKNLGENENIKGYRVECSGRYSRRQRASRRVLREGRVPLNSLSAEIEYGCSKVILKYGVCGIKVWLHKKEEKKIGEGYRMRRVKVKC
jgi:small subunit ribosomal protein S3